MFRRPWILVCLLCIPACSRDAPQTSAGTPPAQTPAPVQNVPIRSSFSGPFSEKTALLLLLKDVDKPLWTSGADGEFLEFVVRGEPHVARTVGQFPFRQRGSEQLLFLFEIVPREGHECHACRVSIGAAAFSRQGQAWQVEHATVGVTEHGGWGKTAAGDFSLVRVGPDRYAIRETSSNMSQGRITSMRDLYEVAPSFPNILSVLVAENNEGACTDDPREQTEIMVPCHAYSSELWFVPGRNADYDDLIVSFQGTEINEQEKKVVPINRDDRFIYRQGKYEKHTDAVAAPGR